MMRGCVIALFVLLCMAWVAAYFRHKNGPIPIAMAADEHDRYLIYGDRKCKDLVASANQIETVLLSSWPYFVDQDTTIFGYAGPSKYLTKQGTEEFGECLDLDAMRADLDYSASLAGIFWNTLLSPFTNYFSRLEEVVGIAADMKALIDTTGVSGGAIANDESHGDAVRNALDRAVNSPCGRIAIQISVMNSQVDAMAENRYQPNNLLLELQMQLAQAKADYTQCLIDWANFRHGAGWD